MLVKGLSDSVGWRRTTAVLSSLRGRRVHWRQGDGWLANCLWECDVPHLYRLRGRCSASRFWSVLRVALGCCGIRCGLLFHHNLAGWRRIGARGAGRFLAIGSNDGLVGWMEAHAYWGGEWGLPGRKCDEYYAVDSERGVVLNFNHEGMFVCFSRDLALLGKMAEVFRRHRLAAAVYGGRRDSDEIREGRVNGTL